MRERFSRELDRIGQAVLSMSGFVIEQIEMAALALRTRDVEAAATVVERDKLVNDRDIAISTECAVLIARDQPVASDLRHIIAYLKVVSDIERIGDYAVHAAKRAKDAAEGRPLLADHYISRMMELGAAMLRDSVRALITRDEALARATALLDEEMDDLKKTIYRDLLALMTKDQDVTRQATKFLFLSRFLERMGDHAVTICSWAVYSASGEYVEL
jgi:phosphate transport system protein